MLQNRVDPEGNLIKTTARGAWMGNRGLLHNDSKEIRRPYKLKAWITCKLEFKGWKRQVMTPKRYTELFFLDEATAFAAGHRPCAECRRDEFSEFKALWLTGNPQYNFSERISIQRIDEVIHGERIDNDNSKISFNEKMADIPNGVFVLLNNKRFLVYNQLLFFWSPFGYAECINISSENRMTVLTPRSIVNAFRAGYAPQIDASMGTHNNCQEK